MMNAFSLDEHILSHPNSTFILRVRGTKKRLNLTPGDILVVDKSLVPMAGKLAVLVIKGKFQIDIVSEEFLHKNDPENGDFIWGMIKIVVRELR